jgi:hypothetical protein
VRLALANILALVVFVCVIWCCFAFIMGFATNSAAAFGFTFKLDHETFGFAMIYMMFIGPFALLLMLLYFGLFRARPHAIMVLAFVAVVLGAAFMTPVLSLPGWPGGKTFGMDVRVWIMIVWAGVTATLAHHLVFAIIRPGRVPEHAL